MKVKKSEIKFAGKYIVIENVILREVISARKTKRK